MAFLQEYAERQSCSLYQALTDNLEDPILKGTGARKLVSLVESLRRRVCGAGRYPRSSRPC